MMLPDRLERKIMPEPNSGCWLWIGAVDRDNYGVAWDAVLERDARAHRLVYEILVGSIPEGKCLCHRCDQPFCVNPDHMFVGTVTENNRDCKRKGRNASGERHGMNKLSAAQVAEIRKSTLSQRATARQYGVSQGLISHIWRGRLWKQTEA